MASFTIVAKTTTKRLGSRSRSSIRWRLGSDQATTKHPFSPQRSFSANRQVLVEQSLEKFYS